MDDDGNDFIYLFYWLCLCIFFCSCNFLDIFIGNDDYDDGIGIFGGFYLDIIMMFCFCLYIFYFCFCIFCDLLMFFILFFFGM